MPRHETTVGGSLGGLRLRWVLLAAALLVAVMAAAILAALHLRSRWSLPPPVPGDLTVALGDGVSMAFVEIAPGTLDVPMHLGGLIPGYELEIDEPYLVSATEVSGAQWRAVMGSPPPLQPDPRKPVWVSFADAQSFIARLQRFVGPRYEAYIPTEVQWEYACRAGDPRDDLATRSPSSIDAIAWHRDNSGMTQEPPPDLEGESSSATSWYGDPFHPVAGKAPNAWGLYDMLGNAEEWCEPDVPADGGDVADDAAAANRVVARGGSGMTPRRNLSPRSVGSAARANPMFKAGVRVVLMRAIE